MQNKNMNKWQNSAFSLLLVIAMIFSMLPVSVFAQDTQDIVPGDSDVATAADTDDGDDVATPPATDGGLLLTDGSENDPNALLECDCEIECTEEAINVDCPVCAEHPEWCVVGVESPEFSAMTQITSALDLTSGGNKNGDGYIWDSSSKYLTLAGLNMEITSGSNEAIKLPGGSTIVLNGTNNITNSVGGGIVAESAGGDLTINGSGSLDITSTSTYGRGIDAWGGLLVESGTIEVSSTGSYGIKVSDNFDVTGGSITATATSTGNNGIDVGGNFTMTDGTVYATGSGTNVAMSVYGTVPSNLAITQSDGTDYAPAAAFDTGVSPKVIKSGGTAVTNAKITFASPDYTLYYNGANGKMFKDSGLSDEVTTAVVPNWSGNGTTLILNEGFEFETSAEIALVMTNGTTIQVNGNATIASTKASAVGCIGIAGDGALAVNVATGKTLTVSTANGNQNRYGILTNGSFTKLGGGTLTATAGNGGSYNSYGISTSDFTMTDGVIIAITNGGSPANAMRVTGNISPSSIPIKGWNEIAGGYTVPASFQELTTFNITKIIQDSDGSAVYNAKLGNEPTPSGGSSGGSSNSPTPAPAPVVAPMDNKSSGTLNNAITSAASTASGDGNNLGVKLRNVSNFTKENAAAIIKKAKELGKKATVSSDVMSEDGTFVEVRVTVDPALITETVRLDGYIRQTEIFMTESRFKKYFDNKTAVIHLAQEGKFGQSAKISAKVELKDFDKSNLFLYSYDKKANKYTLITSKDYKIDKNGYLVFYTNLGGDIIVSDGRLVKKSLNN